jgi:hypothetical protein
VRRMSLVGSWEVFRFSVCSLERRERVRVCVCVSLGRWFPVRSYIHCAWRLLTVRAMVDVRPAVLPHHLSIDETKRRNWKQQRFAKKKNTDSTPQYRLVALLLFVKLARREADRRSGGTALILGLRQRERARSCCMHDTTRHDHMTMKKEMTRFCSHRVHCLVY